MREGTNSEKVKRWTPENEMFSNRSYPDIRDELWAVDLPKFKSSLSEDKRLRNYVVTSAIGVGEREKPLMMNALVEAADGEKPLMMDALAEAADGEKPLMADALEKNGVAAGHDKRRW